MNTRYNLTKNKELEINITETRHWLNTYPKSLKLYNEALDKFKKVFFIEMF